MISNTIGIGWQLGFGRWREGLTFSCHAQLLGARIDVLEALSSVAEEAPS